MHGEKERERDKCAYLYYIKWPVCCRRKICDKNRNFQSARDLKISFLCGYSMEKHFAKLQQHITSSQKVLNSDTESWCKLMCFVFTWVCDIESVRNNVTVRSNFKATKPLRRRWQRWWKWKEKKKKWKAHVRFNEKWKSFRNAYLISV